MNVLFNFIEKYGFALVLLFCFGFFTPDLSPKQGLMFDDSYASTDDGPKSNIIKQVFWISLFLFFTWRCIANKIIDDKKLSQILGILCLCSIALISASWSDFSMLSIKRAIFQIIFCLTTMFTFYYALKHNSLEQILFYSGILIILLIFLSILTGAGFNRSLTLTGFSPGKNILGQNLLAYLILIFLYLKVNDRPSMKLNLLSLAFFLLLILTTSKTSITLFFIFLSLGFLMPKLSSIFLTLLFSILTFIFIILPTLSYYLGDIIHIGQYISHDAITGRGLIWDMLYIDLSFYQKMDFGYGYGTYFNTGVTPIMFDDPWSFLSRITSTHNGYIDMLMQFGFYGCLCILFVVCFLSKNIKNHWLISTLFIAVIYNFTEAAFFRDYSMMWLMTLVVFSYKNSYFDKVNNG